MKQTALKVLAASAVGMAVMVIGRLLGVDPSFPETFFVVASTISVISVLEYGDMKRGQRVAAAISLRAAADALDQHLPSGRESAQALRLSADRMEERWPDRSIPTTWAPSVGDSMNAAADAARRSHG